MSPPGPAPRTVVVDSRTFERIPIRTPVLMPGDDMPAIIREHAGPHLRAGDTVVMSESAVAIMQGRARDWRTIHPSALARFLSERVTKTTWGTGLRSSYAMQYAIELTGAPRILLAGLAHSVGRLLGKKGWFYLVAGLNAARMAKGDPLSSPPRTTAIGALAYYVSHADPAHYDPSNITFGIMEPLAHAPRGKLQRKLAIAERALADLAGWMNACEQPAQSLSPVSQA